MACQLRTKVGNRPAMGLRRVKSRRRSAVRHSVVIVYLVYPHQENAPLWSRLLQIRAVKFVPGTNLPPKRYALDRSKFVRIGVFGHDAAVVFMAKTAGQYQRSICRKLLPVLGGICLTRGSMAQGCFSVWAWEAPGIFPPGENRANVALSLVRRNLFFSLVTRSEMRSNGEPPTSNA